MDFPAHYPTSHDTWGMGKETTSPLHPCSMQDKRLMLKQGYSKLAIWSRCRHLAGFLSKCSISQLETDFFKWADISFGQQTYHPGFQNRALRAGSKHGWKTEPVMTVTGSLARQRYICSAPVKHSCVDPSKFLLSFLGLMVDPQSLIWLHLFKPNDMEINISTF